MESSRGSNKAPETDKMYEQLLTLTEKPNTTIRFFDRDGQIMVYNADAELLAKKFFRSNGVLKKWGDVIYVSLSSNNFENVLKETLLSWHYRVELYVKDNGSWVLTKKASPGNLSHFEDDVFGTDSSESSLQSSETADLNTCFVSIKVSPSDSGSLSIGLAFVDAIMREISVIEFVDTPHLYQLETVLFRKGPKEAIIEKGFIDKPMAAILDRAKILVNEISKKTFDTSSLTQDLNTILLSTREKVVKAAVLPELQLTHACKALAGAIKYLDLVSQYQNGGQFKISTLKEINYMRLDSSAIKALHLLPDPLEGVTKDKCLSGLLNKCRTGQGQRLLKQYLRQPLTDVRLIEERLDCVTVLVNNSDIRRRLHDNMLRRIPDVQRISSKFQKNKAGLKDVYKIFCGVEVLPDIISSLESKENVLSESVTFTQKFLDPLKEVFSDLGKFMEMVKTVLDFSKVDQGQFLINPTFSPNLQEAHEEIEQIRSNINGLLSSVARKIGRDPEKGVKIEIHAVHGHCFRVSVKDDKLVRECKEFTWLDNKKDGIRFTNRKMQDLSEEFGQKMKEYNELQKDLVDKVIQITIGYLDPFWRLSDVIADLDVITSFATVVSTSKDSFVRPTILPSGHGIKATALRHPCLENEENVYFIPNDINLSRNDQNFLIITGPNMGGKSTFIRSVGILCLLAQVGCYVPCTSAEVSVVDAIMARIGAGDELEKGVSTFMAEMLETNVILNTATENSLVIVDELGRGTSTFDGFGLAWAISEHMITNIGCFCLFATHFHEITELANKFENVQNYHFTSTIEGSQLIMMYKIKSGVCDRSYGIHVAQMVKFPEDVLKEAEMKAAELEWPTLTSNDDEIIAQVLNKIEHLDDSLSEEEKMVYAKQMLDDLVANDENPNLKNLLLSIFDSNSN